MNSIIRALRLIPALLLLAGAAHAGNYTETVGLFKNAGESASFFNKSYAYAVFPTIGAGGFVVGGAYGKGRVYVGGKLVGDTSMTQVSVGFQLGGKAYSQIVFFEDKRALAEFESGTFEFDASASAIAVTAAATSVPSNILAVSTLVAAPTNFTATATSATNINLTWTVVTDATINTLLHREFMPDPDPQRRPLRRVQDCSSLLL